VSADLPPPGDMPNGPGAPAVPGGPGNLGPGGVGPGGVGPGGPDGHDDLLDDVDRIVLDRIAGAYAAIDPPPAWLGERVRFALALATATAEDFEVARPDPERLVGSGARADAIPGSERTRTVTFEAPSRTIMVTLVEREDRLVRVDGWLAPPEPLRVELRSATSAGASGSLAAVADATGRFVIDGVPHGLAQIVVHPPAGGVKVVTPSLML
jgi:hypothetical protein